MKSEKGYSLVEIIVAVSISALLAIGAGMTTAQIMRSSRQNNDWNMALRQAQSVGYWVSQDALAVNTIDIGDDPETTELEFFTLFWKDWENGYTYDTRYMWFDSSDSLSKIERNQVILDNEVAELSNTTVLVADIIYSATLTPQTDSWRIRRAVAYLGRGRRKSVVQTAAVFLAAGAAGWLSLDAWNKAVLLTDYYSQREMWPEVLRAADRMPYGLYNVRSNRNVMLALYHMGRLGDEMFRYPQLPGVDLYTLPEADRDPHSCFQESRLYLELGQVNRAERCACEAFESAGDLPAILEHLAVIHIVKDQPETARMFLTALSKKPLHRRAARKMLQQLDEDPRLESDPRIRKIRRSMVRVDSVFPQPVEELLLALLQSNPRNKMAFEFLMAHYLCTGHPDKVVQCLQQPRCFEYRNLPRHFQEAIIVQSIVADGRLPPAEGPLDPEIVHRAGEFCGILASYGSDEEAARTAAVAAGFGDSYLFYYNFGVSGL